MMPAIRSWGKVILAAALMGACGACGVSTGMPSEAREAVATNSEVSRALSATVALYRNGRVVCTGTRVDSRHILTAYHCAVAQVMTDDFELYMAVERGMLEVPAKRVMDQPVLFSSFEDYRAAFDDGADPAQRVGSFVSVDRAHDLALMLTDPSEQPSVRITRELPIPGQPVFAIGNPHGMTFSYLGGWISMPCRVSRMLPDGCWTQVDMTIQGGASGGGLYDLAGRLIGVVSRGDDLMSFFAPANAVADFVYGKGRTG